VQAAFQHNQAMKSVSSNRAATGRGIATRFESGVVVAREARLHPRRSLGRIASISTLDASRDRTGSAYFVVVEGRTLDVGDGGLGLEVEDSLREGSRVLVDVELGEGRTLECRARVVWSAADANGAHFAGLSFDEPQPGLLNSL
jgi:hypothetical protein